MNIDCYMSENCGSYHQLRENVDRALAELGVKADVNYRTVYYDEAAALGIKGSPTIRINGKDLDEGGAPGILWRTYKDESGRLKNVPSVAMLIEAIKRELSAE